MLPCQLFTLHDQIPYHMYVSHTYSCLNICRCTNQSWSWDHPKQTLPHFFSALVNLETTILLPEHGYIICIYLLIYTVMISMIIYIMLGIFITLVYTYKSIQSCALTMCILYKFFSNTMLLSWLCVTCIHVCISFYTTTCHELVYNVTCIFVSSSGTILCLIAYH